MTAPISCEVFVDGTRLADTAASWAQRTPTALSGLSVEWGRDGPQAQPEIGTCSLVVADADGDTEFLGLLKVGAWLEVNSSTTITTEQPSDVVIDPGFTSPPSSRVEATGTAVNDPARDALAPPGHAVKLTQAPTVQGWVHVPPGPFTSHPGGWLMIPQFVDGQTWQISIMLRAGPIPNPGMRFQVIGFEESNNFNITQIGTARQTGAIVGQYVTISDTVTALPAQYPLWLGVQITGLISPAWNAVPAGTTWANVGVGAWGEVGAIWLDEMHAYPPLTTARRARVFTGRITDLIASAMGGQAVQVEITATEWTADLANQNLGDVPWLKERLDARAGRICSYAARRPSIYLDARCAAFQVSWVDVDNQPLYPLLEDLAITGDGVLWPIARDVLWVEDPETRASVGSLGPDPGGSGLITVYGGRDAGAVLLDSCDVGRDELRLEQNVEDIVTRVALTWLDQTLDEQGNQQPTDVTLYRDDLNAQSTLGIREFAVSTQLTTAADGQAVGDRKLARSRANTWHADGLVWDTRISPDDVDHQLAALRLLDLTARVGCLLTVTDVPAWIPLGPDLSAYVEGGTYRFEGGRWILEIGLAPSSVSGTSAKWTDLDPAWHWNMFDPLVAWVDLWGVDSIYTRSSGDA